MYNSSENIQTMLINIFLECKNVLSFETLPVKSMPCLTGDGYLPSCESKQSLSI